MIELFKNWTRKYFSDPQIIILALLLAVGFVLVFTLGDMLAPVIAALVIAFLLEGLVSRLERLGTRRNTGVILVFCMFMACLLALLVILLPMLVNQTRQFVSELPKMVLAARDALTDLPIRHPDLVSQDQIRQLLEGAASQISELGQRAVSWSLASVKGLITFIIYLVLVPLLVFFFLKDKDKIKSWLRRFLPRERHLASSVWREVNHQMGNYVRGQFLRFLIVWGATWLTYLVLGLNYSMLAGFLVGLSTVIPYIGATLVTIPIALFALFQWGWGSELVYALSAYGILQLLDGNLLAPLLLSGVVNLHPVAIIIAVLVFGGLWGVWGLFFAIPLATLFNAVINAWFVRIEYRRRLQENQQQPQTQQMTEKQE